MAAYRIVIRKSAAKEIEKLRREDRQRVVEKIYLLAENPRPTGSKKLSGQEKYRVRQGVYRILYEIIDHELVVTVVRVAHRREACRD